MLGVAITTNAQKSNQQKEVKTAIEQFFKGIHKGNPTGIQRNHPQESCIRTLWESIGIMRKHRVQKNLEEYKIIHKIP